MTLAGWLQHVSTRCQPGLAYLHWAKGTPWTRYRGSQRNFLCLLYGTFLGPFRLIHKSLRCRSTMAASLLYSVWLCRQISLITSSATAFPRCIRGPSISNSILSYPPRARAHIFSHVSSHAASPLQLQCILARAVLLVITGGAPKSQIKNPKNLKAICPSRKIIEKKREREEEENLSGHTTILVCDVGALAQV